MIKDSYQQQIDAVSEYIDGVMSGNVVVGELERLAVQRHLADLEQCGGPDRPYYFDPELAGRAVRFFPMILRHATAEWHSEPFWLSGWQSFVCWVLYGWRTPGERLRRFRKAYISMGRKNGKTTFIGGLTLLSVYADEPAEHRGEAYCTATTKKQADILLDIMEAMVRMSPALNRRSQITTTSIHNTEFDSYIKSISSGVGQHGTNPSVQVIDELHEFCTDGHRKSFDAVTTGSGSRRQPLSLLITTSGDPGGGSPIWQEEEDFAEKVLRAPADKPVADHLFAYICRMDKDDDPLDEKNWRKANPNLGVSVKKEYLKIQAAEAKVNPAARHKFLRFHANFPTGSKEKAINLDRWDACQRDPLPLEGRPCFGGLDVGRVYDFSGLALLFPVPDAYQTYTLKSWIWAAEGNPHVPIDRDPYLTWAKNGELRVHPGDALDFEQLEVEILEIMAKYNVRSMAFDEQQARLLAQRLHSRSGVEIKPFVQSHGHYNEPTKQLILRVNNQQILHAGEPAIRWQMDNAVIAKNVRDQWMIDKSHETRKVDGVVASIMALAEAMFHEDRIHNYYETHDVEFI